MHKLSRLLFVLILGAVVSLPIVYPFSSAIEATSGQSSSGSVGQTPENSERGGNASAIGSGDLISINDNFDRQKNPGNEPRIGIGFNDSQVQHTGGAGGGVGALGRIPSDNLERNNSPVNSSGNKILSGPIGNKEEIVTNGAQKILQVQENKDNYLEKKIGEGNTEKEKKKSNDSGKSKSKSGFGNIISSAMKLLKGVWGLMGS